MERHPLIQKIKDGKDYFATLDEPIIKRLLNDLLSAVAYCRDAGNDNLYFVTDVPEFLIRKALAKIDLSKLNLSITFFDSEPDARIAAAKVGAFVAIAD